MVVFFLTLIFGGMLGFGVFALYGSYQVDQLKKRREDLYRQVKEKAAEMEAKTLSIKERLQKASEIASAQADLRAQAELPSKNATHSRHKNGIISEISNLEQQKIDILKTILAEGYDPAITVVHDGGTKQEVALSEYVAMAQQNVDAAGGTKKTPPPIPPPPGDSVDSPKQVGRFFVYKGGKPDGTVH